MSLVLLLNLFKQYTRYYIQTAFAISLESKKNVLFTL